MHAGDDRPLAAKPTPAAPAVRILHKHPALLRLWRQDLVSGDLSPAPSALHIVAPSSRDGSSSALPAQLAARGFTGRTASTAALGAPAAAPADAARLPLLLKSAGIEGPPNPRGAALSLSAGSSPASVPGSARFSTTVPPTPSQHVSLILPDAAPAAALRPSTTLPGGLSVGPCLRAGGGGAAVAGPVVTTRPQGGLALARLNNRVGAPGLWSAPPVTAGAALASGAAGPRQLLPYAAIGPAGPRALPAK